MLFLGIFNKGVKEALRHCREWEYKVMEKDLINANVCLHVFLSQSMMNSLGWPTHCPAATSWGRTKTIAQKYFYTLLILMFENTYQTQEDQCENDLMNRRNKTQKVSTKDMVLWTLLHPFTCEINLCVYLAKSSYTLYKIVGVTYLVDGTPYCLIWYQSLRWNSIDSS